MPATPTDRLGLNKQDPGDASWHTALDAGFDVADARFQLASLPFSGAFSPYNTAVAFTGVGLDDMTAPGTAAEFSNPDRKVVVEITVAGTPDEYKVSVDGGLTFGASTVIPNTSPIDIGVQGIDIQFAATTGHTVGESWAFSAYAGAITDPNEGDDAGSPGPANPIPSDFVGQRFYAEADKIWYTAAVAGANPLWFPDPVITAGADPADPISGSLHSRSSGELLLGTGDGLLAQNPQIYATQSAFPAAGVAGRFVVALDTAQVFIDNGSTYVPIVASGVAVSGLPPQHLSGGQLTWTDGDRMAVAAYKARDDADTGGGSAALLNKNVTTVGAWTSGPDGVAFEGTVPVDGWAHVFAIFKDDGSGDWGVDTDPGAGNLMAGANVVAEEFIRSRRIGSILYETSQMRKFIQRGNYFWWDIPIINFSEDYLSVVDIGVPLSVPPDISPLAFVNFSSADPSGRKFYIHGDLVQDLAVTETNFDPLLPGNPGHSYSSDGGDGSGAQIMVQCADVPVLRFIATTTLQQIHVVTLGWRDHRGKES